MGLDIYQKKITVSSKGYDKCYFEDLEAIMNEVNQILEATDFENEDIVFFDTKAYKSDKVTPQFVTRSKKIYNAYLEDDDVSLMLNEEIANLMPESWK